MYKHKEFWFTLGAGMYTFFSYFYQAVGVFLGVVKYLGMPSEDRKVPTPHTTSLVSGTYTESDDKK
ncbi:MAG: hypothetical protein OXI43_18570 [Candidatus Poribacteria bacterium]|nr:hypothetical protein [Candidatus Poribacteria bacterium]